MWKQGKWEKKILKICKAFHDACFTELNHLQEGSRKTVWMDAKPLGIFQRSSWNKVKWANCSAHINCLSFTYSQ